MPRTVRRIHRSSVVRRSCSFGPGRRLRRSLLGVSEQTLRNWRREGDVDPGCVEGLTSDEREELRRLRRKSRHAGAPDPRGGRTFLRAGDQSPVMCSGVWIGEKGHACCGRSCLAACLTPVRSLELRTPRR